MNTDILINNTNSKATSGFYYTHLMVKRRAPDIFTKVTGLLPDHAAVSQELKKY
jgi:hypothetical protein